MKKEDKNEKKSNAQPKHYSILSNILYFIRILRKYEPIVLVLCMIEIALGTALPLFGIYLPKFAIDLVVEQAPAEKAIRSIILFTLFMMAANGIYSAVNSGKYFLYNTQRGNLIGLLFLKSLRIQYKYTESDEMKKNYWKAIDVVNGGDFSAYSRTITGSVHLISSLLRFCLYSAVIGILSPGMLISIIALSFIVYFFQICHIRYEESLREERAQADRRYYTILSSIRDTNGAKDIRIFGMAPWLTALRDKALSALLAVSRKSFMKTSFYERIQFSLAMIRDLGAYAFLIYQAVHGKISGGDFVLYFGAVTGFSNFITDIMNGLSQLRAAANSTDYFRAYMELPEEDRESGSQHIKELELPLKIEFRNICFSYHSMERTEECTEGNAINTKEKMIFHNLNLTINAGEKIALVGANGAGKTTLVKLLCGLYEPDEGQIFINGIDRNEFPKKELYELFSVVFQEQLILPFTVGENITLHKKDQVDRKRAWSALEKAGLKTVFEEKNIDIDTYMTKQMMKAGIELSGGQQQRFLLARALYKNAPILVLDEPTAALDPIAESEIYQKYNQYSQNKTAIFISHRLASTRFSDRIIMIDQGKIIETGTHEELMQKNGAYAKMFQVQSSYYQDTASEEISCQF